MLRDTGDLTNGSRRSDYFRDPNSSNSISLAKGRIFRRAYRWNTPCSRLSISNRVFSSMLVDWLPMTPNASISRAPDRRQICACKFDDWLGVGSMRWFGGTHRLDLAITSDEIARHFPGTIVHGVVTFNRLSLVGESGLDPRRPSRHQVRRETLACTAPLVMPILARPKAVSLRVVLPLDGMNYDMKKMRPRSN